MPQRYAMLVVALVAAADAWAQVRVVPGLPGAQSSGAAQSKEPMTVDAERIEGVGSLEIGARGAAEIAQDELNIFGETLRLNQEFGTVEGDGGVRLKSGVDRFFGPRLRYNMLDDTGVFEQPQFLLRRELPARGTAESMEFLGKDKYRFKNATFTTCEPGNDDWMIVAKELTLDYTIEEGVAKSPRLHFFDLPILGAPYVSFPLENSRKSGLLTPYYSHSSTRGFEAGIPYYWNIAPEYDATITPSYMTKRGSFLRNEGRYLNRDYKGDLRLEYMPEDAELKRERHGVSWNHAQTLAPGMGLNVDFNRVSDDRYFVDLTSQVRQSSIGNLQQDAYVGYSGALPTGPYSAQVRVQRFQTLQDPLAPIVPPYHRVPQLNFATSVNNLGGVLDANLPVEYARFLHSSLQQGTRVSVSPTVTAPVVISPGAFFTPKAGLRYVGYNLQDAPAGSTGRPAAAIPWMSLDTGLIFDREARFFGENLTQTLEPRLFYVNIPYRNQDPMPLFDTALADFNFPQLFTENRFNGGDRFGDANQLTSAVTSRFLSAGGQEAFRATIGQINYFRDERVGLTPVSTLRTFHTSDLLASVGGRPLRSWTFDTTVQYNRRDSTPQRYTLATRYSPETAKVLSASYRFNQDPANPVKQVDISGQWPLRPGWYAVGRYNYSLLDKRLVDGVGGLEYNAGCWVFRAVFQRIQAAAQVSSTAFFFQLEFTGVGQIGTDEVITLLKRNVSGYSITNPRDPTFAPPSARKPLPFEQIY